MKENVGRIDAIMRSVEGPALIAFGLYSLNRQVRRKPRLWPSLLAIAAGFWLTQSALTRVSLANRLFGIDSRNWDRKLQSRKNRGAFASGTPAIVTVEETVWVGGNRGDADQNRGQTDPDQDRDFEQNRAGL